MKTLLNTLTQRIFIGALIFTHCHLMATTYTLTLLTNGSGTVAPNPNLAAYPANSTVTITASPGGGSYFSNFTGDASSTSNVVNVQMTANRTVTANFAPLPNYSLTVTTNGSGSVALSPSGGLYASNTLVQATAIPASNWLFLNWTNAVSTTNNPVSLTMNSNASISATFVEPPLVDIPPQSVSTNIGANVMFSVMAEALPAPAYQWYFIGTPITGASGTNLVLTNVQSSQSGAYSIVVSNVYGMTSNSAILTLTNPPTGTNVVTSLTEDALAAAIQAGGVVTFGSNGVIYFTNAITITNDVVLDGTGSLITVNGNNTTRLFNITPGVTVSVTNLSFVNGQYLGANGGGTGTTNIQPGTNGFGGAFFVDSASLFLTGCSLLSNSATGGSGTYYGDLAFGTYSTSGAGMGGAIYIVNGILTLDSTLLSSNMANEKYGWTNAEGGAVFALNSTVTLSGCIASNNICVTSNAVQNTNIPAALGGAIYVQGGFLACSNSSFYSNTAYGGNVPTTTSLPFSQAGNGHGGAVAALGSTVITHCIFAQNMAHGGVGFRYSISGDADGGALYATSNVSISTSTFASNVALAPGYSATAVPASGGGIYMTGTGSISASVIYSNTALCQLGFSPTIGGFAGAPSFGGGIFNAGTLALTNCTIALNLAQGATAADYATYPAGAFGGGIYNTNGSVTGIFLTVASNVALEGGAYPPRTTNFSGDQVANTNGTFTLENSILAYSGPRTNAHGTITDDGYNISSDGTANFSSGTSFNYTDPLLGPLANNGGPTWTMALSPDSPAVDFAVAVAGVITDQRDYLRPFGAGYDVGAFELGASDELPTLTLTRAATNLTLSYSAISGKTYVLQSTSSLSISNWTAIQTNIATNNQTVSFSISYSTNLAEFYRLYMP